MKNTNSTLIWTLMAFARYEAFELLDNYNKVLYLDTDVLIQKDIIELLNINKDISVSHEGTNLRGNIENKLFAEKFDSDKYNLDTKDYKVQKWSELENVRYFYEFFRNRKNEFKK